MELQRILAKDSRSAMEQVHALYGKDALVVSNKRAKDKTELIVAVDLEAEAKNSLDEIIYASEKAIKHIPATGRAVGAKTTRRTRCPKLL